MASEKAPRTLRPITSFIPLPITVPRPIVEAHLPPDFHSSPDSIVGSSLQDAADNVAVATQTLLDAQAIAISSSWQRAHQDLQTSAASDRLVRAEMEHTASKAKKAQKVAERKCIALQDDLAKQNSALAFMQEEKDSMQRALAESEERCKMAREQEELTKKRYDLREEQGKRDHALELAQYRDRADVRVKLAEDEKAVMATELQFALEQNRQQVESITTSYEARLASAARGRQNEEELADAGRDLLDKYRLEAQKWICSLRNNNKCLLEENGRLEADNKRLLQQKDSGGNETSKESASKDAAPAALPTAANTTIVPKTQHHNQFARYAYTSKAAAGTSRLEFNRSLSSPSPPPDSPATKRKAEQVAPTEASDGKRSSRRTMAPKRRT